jgi:hypothetical protein
MMPPSRLGVAFIIPTSMYVETSVNTAERSCEGSLLGENCQSPATVTRPPATKYPKPARFRVIVVTGVHARKASWAQEKGVYPQPATRVRLVPGLATRCGRSFFFGQRRKDI